jgi:hypothetical protein
MALAVAVVASYVPIRRPAKVNPMTHYQSNCRVRGDSLEASSGVIAMDSYPISPDPGLRNETRLNEAARRYACDTAASMGCDIIPNRLSLFLLSPKHSMYCRRKSTSSHSKTKTANDPAIVLKRDRLWQAYPFMGQL